MADTQVKGVSITATTVKELKAQIKGLKDEIQQLVLTGENYEAQAQQLTELQLRLSKATDTVAGSVKGVKGSYAELVQETNKLRKEWRSVEIGSERFKELTEQINANNDKLKEFDAGIGDHFRNVGNYAGRFTRALSPLGGAFSGIATGIDVVLGSIDAWQGLSGAIIPAVKALRAWITSLGAVKGAIASTGIGALVVALGLLVANFDKLKESISNFIRSDINTALANLEDGAKKLTDALKDLRAESSREIALAQAMGADDLELIQLENEALTEQKNRVESLIKAQEPFTKRQVGERYGLLLAQWTEEDAKRVKEINEKLNGELDAINSQLYENETKRQVAEIKIEIAKETEKKKIAQDAKARAEKQAQEAQALREKELSQIKAWRKDAELNLLDAEQREITILTEGYVEKLALFEKYGADTTALTEYYEAEKAKIKAKYNEVVAKEFQTIATEEEQSLTAWADSYLAELETKRNEAEAQISAIRTNESEQLRYAELAEGPEIKKAKRIYDIKQQALMQEQSLLQQGLNNEIYLGEERIAIAERVAQIQRDLAFNTAEYEKKVSKDATDKKNANTQSALQVASASASAMSSILGSIADMYEAEGEQNEQATKKAKNLRIAGATMDMLGGLVSAWTSALNPANSGLTIWGQIAMATLTSATILASGIANIQKIKNTDTSGNSSGGGIGASVSAPAIVQQVPVTRTLTGVAEEQRLNEGQRVYVVYDDIAQAGRKVDVTESEATF